MYERLIHFFSRVGLKYFGGYTQPLKELVEKSNLPIIYEKYLGQLFFYSFLALVTFLFYFLFLFQLFWNFTLVATLLASILLSATVTSTIATIFYFYPFYKYNKKMKDIDRNLSLGIAYMNIISQSGVPPEKMFKYVAERKEFGELAKECERIYKYLKIAGKDITSAVKEVAFRTPSEKLKTFLDGFSATIMSGSDLNLYLREEARKGMENYKEIQKKYTSLIGFFSDIFIILFLIAPLVVMIILTSFSLIESSVAGIDIKFLLSLIVYVATPSLGAIFLLILYNLKV